MANLEAWSRDVAFGICGDCGAIFGVSEARPWSGCHGSEPVRLIAIDYLLSFVGELAERLYALDRGDHAGAASREPGPPDSGSPPTHPDPDSPARAGQTSAPPQGEPAAIATPAKGPKSKPSRARGRTTRASNPSPAAAAGTGA